MNFDRSAVSLKFESLLLVINLFERYKKWDIAWMACDSLYWVVVNPIAVNSFEFLFNCTTVSQVTDSMKT